MQYEKLRYQPNKTSQTLTLFGMSFMVFALFKVINVYRYTNRATEGLIIPKIGLGFEILIAITVMLISFLASEKLKSYDRKWLPVSLFLSIYSLVKIFILPISLFKEMNKMIENGEVIKYNPKTWILVVIISLIVSALLHALSTYIAFVKTNQLEQYNKEMSLQDGK